MKSNSIKSLTIATLITLSTVTAQAIVTDVEINKIYTATFDRIADKAGLDYWLNSGLTIEEIAQSFFDQDETREKYPDGLPQNEFVEAVYKNLFARTPDEDGLEYWIKELNSGNITPGNFILAVINGAKGDDITILNKKAQVSKDFLDGKITKEQAQEDLKNVITTLKAEQAKEAKEAQERADLEVFIENSDILITAIDKARVRDKFNKGGLDLAKAEEAKIRNEKRIKEDSPKLEEELDTTDYLTDEDKKSITKEFKENSLTSAIKMLNELEKKREDEVEVPSTGGGSTVSTPSTGSDTGGGSGNGTGEAVI